MYPIHDNGDDVIDPRIFKTLNQQQLFSYGPISDQTGKVVVV